MCIYIYYIIYIIYVNVCIYIYIIYNINIIYVNVCVYIYIYCETPSVLTKVLCSSHDMDLHPFTCVMSGLTKGWAAVRDLSHRGKGIGCLCGGLVGEAAINIGSGAAW